MTSVAELVLQSLRPAKRDSFEWWVNAVPRWAPATFRGLPPIEDVDHSRSACQEGCCYTLEKVGAGVSANELAVCSNVSRCLACASDNTRVIHLLHECTFYRRDHESVHHERVEYECVECGKFSSYSNRWTD